MRAIITVVGGDKVGIVFHVTKVLMEHDLNIIDLSQTVMGEDTFVMLMLVEGDNLKNDMLQVSKKLQKLGDEIGVAILMQRLEVFQAMHNI